MQDIINPNQLLRSAGLPSNTPAVVQIAPGRLPQSVMTLEDFEVDPPGIFQFEPATFCSMIPSPWLRKPILELVPREPGDYLRAELDWFRDNPQCNVLFRKTADDVLATRCLSQAKQSGMDIGAGPVVTMSQLSVPGVIGREVFLIPNAHAGAASPSVVCLYRLLMVYNPPVASGWTADQFGLAH